MAITIPPDVVVPVLIVVYLFGLAQGCLVTALRERARRRGAAERISAEDWERERELMERLATDPLAIHPRSVGDFSIRAKRQPAALDQRTERGLHAAGPGTGSAGDIGDGAGL